MAGMGTGTPNSYLCPRLRRVYYKRRLDHPILYDMHRVQRTGRTKPYLSRRQRTQRTLFLYHEVECSCGYTGWSRISPVLALPLKEGADEPEWDGRWDVERVTALSRSRKHA